jgi:hypothetical protein
MTKSHLLAGAIVAALSLAPAAYLLAAAAEPEANAKRVDSDAAHARLAADSGAPTASSAKTTDAHGFVSLFDGKSLDGWEGREGFWSVQDGCITGQTKENFGGPNTFLVWKGGDVDNFEFHCKYKIVGGNSGIQYRSKMLDDNSKKLFRVGGYQADFEAGRTYSGILYEEGGRGILAQRGTKVALLPNGQKRVEKLPMTSEQLQGAIKNEDWNDYTVIAKGNHLTHKINGNTTAEVIDESGKGAKSGILALQLHQGPPMTVQFKDLHLKKLAADAK